MKKSTWAVLLTVAVLGGCGAKGGAARSIPAGPNSGIEGLALIINTCPGRARLEKPCPPKPLEAAFVVDDPVGIEVIKFRSEADGSFKVYLEPGAYFIRPDLSQPFPLPAAGLRPPVKVVVGAGKFQQLTLKYDSGMR